jgi:phenylpropionate dioxygenase-like ring-hydroxylating dioxygenase large terminal subunit
VTRSPASLDTLLTALKERAGRSAAEARALPPDLYRSEELFALEQERIFSKEWLCAGRADEIPEPGDYLTYTIAEQPVVVIRQRDASLRAFANVCLHRMMRLLEGSGSCKRITCPYHAWSYEIDGRLAAAPHMERTANFEVSEHRLPEVRCEEWLGWIYVTLDSDIEPIADRLAPLGEVTASYRMEDYVHVVRQDHVWQTNWKLLVENFMEGYHLPVLHRKSVGAWYPMEETRFPDESYDAFAYHSFIKSSDAKYGVAPPSNTSLDGKQRQTSIISSIFPAHMYVLAPDHFWYLSVQPLAVDRMHLRFGASVAPETLASIDDRDEYVRELVEFFDGVNAEDRSAVETIFQNTKGVLSAGGPLSWTERVLHDFARYLARRLTGA